MEEGFITTDGTLISWTKGAMSLKGETLSWSLLNAHLQAMRCPSCKLVAARY